MELREQREVCASVETAYPIGEAEAFHLGIDVERHQHGGNPHIGRDHP